MNKEATCNERIADQLESREFEMSELFSLRDKDEQTQDGEDAQESIANFPLAITTKTLTIVEISTGGPADSLEIVSDSDTHEVERVTYRFSDWFDTATIEVPEGSALWLYAEQITNY